MSWSIEERIGEGRPWPEQVMVYRGETDECLVYVSSEVADSAYDVGYRDGSIHYELKHCPACKNVADLQEALAENAKLRELVRHLYECMCNIDADGNYECDSCEYDNAEGECDFERLMRELGVEADEWAT